MSGAPPIPADADLRHMPSYMIDVQSLLDSDLAAFGDPAANWYAVLTWCAALHQIPAGSLPDDDAVLAYLVRLGRDVRTWKKFKDKGALRGWVKHSDGRLYHPVVTKKVLDLLGKSRAGRAAAAAREAAKKGQATENADSDRIDRSSTDINSIQQNNNKGREGKGIEEKGREDRSALGQGADREPTIPTLIPDTPMTTRKSRRQKQSAPVTALDPNFELTEEDRQYARDRHWDDRVIDQQFEKFKNHHIGKGNRWADWHRAWMTWVGNGYDFKGGRPGAPPPRSRADSTADGILAGMQAHERSDR